MPMTPWHVGPGLACKAVLGRRMNLTVFIVAQGVMDVEVVAKLLMQRPHIHGWSHTYLGAALIGAALSAVAYGAIRLFHRKVDADATRAIVCGAELGTLSHVLLDSVMHSDLRPFDPFSHANPMLQWLNIPQLYELCYILGAIGVSWMLIEWALQTTLKRIRKHRVASP
ncbi:MAG: hypothetical protein IT440_14430 [Phycisphaeraceae bacterium]|nr:hypothetical protein [Phycisphaeraceae bacterium]